MQPYFHRFILRNVFHSVFSTKTTHKYASARCTCKWISVSTKRSHLCVRRRNVWRTLSVSMTNALSLYILNTYSCFLCNRFSSNIRALQGRQSPLVGSRMRREQYAKVGVLTAPLTKCGVFTRLLWFHIERQHTRQIYLIPIRHFHCLGVTVCYFQTRAMRVLARPQRVLGLRLSEFETLVWPRKPVSFIIDTHIDTHWYPRWLYHWGAIHLLRLIVLIC